MEDSLLKINPNWIEIGLDNKKEIALPLSTAYKPQTATFSKLVFLFMGLCKKEKNVKKKNLLHFYKLNTDTDRFFIEARLNQSNDF